MKITINSKTLSAIIDRAAACTMAKATIESLESVQIDVYGGKITAYASNIVERVLITFPAYSAEIIEEGTARVRVGDWKKLLKADGEITLESKDNMIKVSSAKKKSSVPAVLVDIPEYPDIEETQDIFTAPVDELTEIFKKLNPCIAKEDTRPVLCGYHVCGESNGAVKFYTLDGYHLMKKTSDLKASGKFSVLIPEAVNKSFPKIAGKSGEVKVRADKKYTVFTGEDFTYIVRNIEGEPFNEENAIPTSSAGEFKVDAVEVAKIAKDYVKTIGKGSARMNPIRLFAGESRAVLGMACNGYSTTDEVKITEESIPSGLSRFPGYYAALFDSRYASDIFGTFDGNVIVKFARPVDPVVVESDGYLGLLLPIAEKTDAARINGTNNLATLAGIAMAEEVA